MQSQTDQTSKSLGLTVKVTGQTREQRDVRALKLAREYQRLRLMLILVGTAFVQVPSEGHLHRDDNGKDENDLNSPFSISFFVIVINKL